MKGNIIFLLIALGYAYSGYIIQTDNFSASAVRATSTTYILNDAAGEPFTGKSVSTNYMEFGGIYHIAPFLFLVGDVNGDGSVNRYDIDFLANYLYYSGPAPEPLMRGDLNADGIVNDLDLVTLTRLIYQNKYRWNRVFIHHIKPLND